MTADAGELHRVVVDPGPRLETLGKHVLAIPLVQEDLLVPAKVGHGQEVDRVARVVDVLQHVVSRISKVLLESEKQKRLCPVSNQRSAIRNQRTVISSERQTRPRTALAQEIPAPGPTL
jgi:hypothetical protein